MTITDEGISEQINFVDLWPVEDDVPDRWEVIAEPVHLSATGKRLLVSEIFRRFLQIF
jgi:hypothetical protein